MSPKTTQPRKVDKSGLDDTAKLSLSKADRNKLGMDAWEPSLLRKLLAAQNRLRTKK
jgi:hypothetical protein